MSTLVQRQCAADIRIRRLLATLVPHEQSSVCKTSLLGSTECCLMQVCDWLRRLTNTPDDEPVDEALLLEYTTEAQRGVGSRTSLQLFQQLVFDFQASNRAAFGVLAPCSITRHPQPCYCPFLNFCQQRHRRRFAVVPTTAPHTTDVQKA